MKAGEDALGLVRAHWATVATLARWPRSTCNTKIGRIDRPSCCSLAWACPVLPCPDELREMNAASWWQLGSCRGCHGCALARICPPTPRQSTSPCPRSLRLSQRSLKHSWDSPSADVSPTPPSPPTPRSRPRSAYLCRCGLGRLRRMRFVRPGWVDVCRAKGNIRRLEYGMALDPQDGESSGCLCGQECDFGT